MSDPVQNVAPVAEVKADEKKEVEIEVEPEYYVDVPLGGHRGTKFFGRVYLLVTIQYFLSTFSIWFATGDALPEDFKETYKNHVVGWVSIFLLTLIWVGGYFLEIVYKKAKEEKVTQAWWWWAVYGVYVVVFAYTAGYVASNDVFDVNFLFNLYILTSFVGVWIYVLIAEMQGWYLRPGFMIIIVFVFNYCSWTLMHYAGLTDAGFTANLLTAGAAGLIVILGIIFTAVCLEDGQRYKTGEEVYAAVLFLVETFIIVYLLLASLYVQPRKPFIAKTPKDFAQDLEKKINEPKAEEKAAEPVKN